VGVFANLRKMLHLESDLVALQELSKGKLTTLPAGIPARGYFSPIQGSRVFRDCQAMDFAGLSTTLSTTWPWVRPLCGVEPSSVSRSPTNRARRWQTVRGYTDDFAFTRTPHRGQVVHHRHALHLSLRGQARTGQPGEVPQRRPDFSGVKE